MTADPAIRAIAALEDDLRRGMHAFIRSAGRPVTRDEAAAAVGISRKLAAFHLDKLVEAGTLRAHYAPGAGGRRAGRAPKVYEPSGTDIRVSIPPRRPDILASILLDAVLSERHPDDVRGAALRVARHRGRAIGAAERERGRPGRLGPERGLTMIAALLEQRGFEPARQAPGCVQLRNCPFHPLAAQSPELVCGINHEFLSGVIDGLGAVAVKAVLRPCPGHCCVELRARSSSG